MPAISRADLSRFTGAASSRHDIPDPYLDMATMAMPQTMSNALHWSEYIYMVNGTYRMAMERIISYFLTDIELGEASQDEKDKYTEFLLNTMDVMVTLQNVMRDRMAYGNSFSSIIVPFKRFLRCPKSGSSFPLSVVYNNPEFKFEWSNFQFLATCPQTGWRGPWAVDDKPEDEDKKIQIKRWSPHDIEILHDPLTDDCAYLWRIPEDYKKQIRQGNLYHLERASMPVIRAVQYDQMFRFNDGVIYHMKEPTLGGIRNRGWGVPRVLSNFRQLWYVQVLRRYNEAIALDYVIPFRLITPAPKAGGGGGIGGGQGMDPLMNFGGGDFAATVNRMIKKRRRDPASWNTLPFPVQYQMLGGDANQLAPTDLLNQGTEQLLNEAGTPVEMYNGSMQMQTAPVALRLFESTWHHLVHDANNWLIWMVRQLSQLMSWESIDIKLRRVTIADDMQKQMALLQLMMGQQASGTTAFKHLGLNWREEQRLMGEEAREQAEMQARIQEEMEQAGFAAQMTKGMVPGQEGGGDPAAGGGAPPGGDPAAAGGGDPAAGGGAPPAGGGPASNFIAQMGPNTPISPEELGQAADTIAQELLGLPESVRRSELIALKKHNEALHALVRAKMDQIRNTVRMQAGAQQGV